MNRHPAPLILGKIDISQIAGTPQHPRNLSRKQGSRVNHLGWGLSRQSIYQTIDCPEPNHASTQGG